MKRLIVLLISGVLLLGQYSLASADYRKDRNYYVGEIISVDVKENKITIYDYTDTVTKTFVVENGVDKDLKPGVEVMVSVIKGTNTARKVKLIVPRSLNI